MEEPFYVKNSASLNIAFLVIGIIFLGLGVFAMLKFAFWIGLFITVVFAFAVPVFIYRIFDKRPRITIDAAGITDRPNRVGLIEWDDIIIEQTTVVNINNNLSIGLKLRDSKKYLSRMPKAFRALGAVDKAVLTADLHLNLGGTDSSPDKFTEMMGKYYQIYLSRKQF
jgi:hypothetical protein